MESRMLAALGELGPNFIVRYLRASWAAASG